MTRTQRNILSDAFLVVVIITFLSSCNLPAQAPKTISTPGFTPVSALPEIPVTFHVTVTKAIPPGDSIYITLLDEVTGLAFNPHQYILHADDPQHYSITLPLYLGKVIKYRYSRQGANTVNEHLYNDRPVRYRLYQVTGPGTVEDMVSGWTDSIYTGQTGRIMGNITDNSNGKPAANILVTAGGEQTFSLADGSFLLEGLTPGMHNLAFYSLDGTYSFYQQGAVVAADSTTPASVGLSPTRLVTVIFTVKVPSGTPSDAPLRLAGNLFQLGNTFADLAGGVSSLPNRMPILGKLSDGRYMVTLSLPAGTYLEYKYTLGDGLWSSELTSQGEYRIRQLIIPNTDLERDDTINAWGKSGTSTISFEVKIPAETPANDSISIQFNPGYGWLEPLPMWSALDAQGEAIWKFDLTGPFNELTSLRYRYCRQDQCGSADDASTAGADPAGRVINPSTNPGTVKDVVLSWAWFTGPPRPPSVPDVQVNSRTADFVAGVAFQSSFHPSWETLLPQAVQDAQAMGVNWLILSPTWTFTNPTPPILEPEPQQDMLLPDLLNMISTTQHAKLNVAIYPQAHFPYFSSQWWQTARRDYSWWVSFFERYSNFILHHASIAAQTGANTLILGGDWLNPALPGGTLSDGSPSNVPQDAEVRWRNLISKVRERYSGTVAWALPYPDGLRNPPAFLDAVDQIYLLWSAPLATEPGAGMQALQTQAASILDQEVQPFQQTVGKPIIIAIAYPSIDRGALGCIAIQGGGCLDYALLAPPNTDIPALALDLQTQADAYNAVLSAVNDRAWINGYVSMGYYPPAELQDKSLSIHGKPAAGILWYWSQKYLGR